MRRLIVGLIAAGSAAVGVAADRAATTERVELPGFYGNTWEMRRPEATVWIFINQDGTWDGIFAGVFQHGRVNWQTIDGNTCFVSPPGDKEPGSLCFGDLAHRKPGDSWQLTAVGRDKVWDATLYEGRKIPPTKTTAQK